MNTNTDESMVPQYELPELLRFQDGSPVNTAGAWAQRRRELLELSSGHIYGSTPGEPVTREVEQVDDSPVLGGLARRIQTRLTLRRNRHEIALNLLIYLPETAATATGGCPVFVGLNFGGNQTVETDPGIRLSTSYTIGTPDGVVTEASRGKAAGRWPVRQIVSRGYAVATLHCGDVDPDVDRGFSTGPHRMFYAQGQQAPGDAEWGTIGAWAWGLSRVLDHLEEVPGIDHTRAIAIGHSRLGKAALWAGAQDERFAGVISNDSGCGGAALYRRCFGERIEDITTSFPHWFCKAHRRYSGDEAALPVDQHMLLALIAPRMLHVASATEDLWADPLGEYLGARHATQAYRLLGSDGLPDAEPHGMMTNGLPAAVAAIGNVLRYHRRVGPHDITLEDWNAYIDHADWYFSRRRIG
ncbi:MAG: acetylxylan esterase [Spirochaetales bacterium]|nr:MAG: acetylxylan esterase [Spirochaetales bacterium]